MELMRLAGLAGLGACLVMAGARGQGVESAGLPNLAEGATATASEAAGGYGPERAIDGQPGTRWAAAAERLPQWLELTFPQPVTLDTVVLQSFERPATYAALEQVVLSFDAGEPVLWNLAASAGPQRRRFAPRTSRTLRLTVQSLRGRQTYLGIADLAVFSDPARKVRILRPARDDGTRPDLTAQGRAAHPCVNKTPADLAQARANLARYPWLADWVASQRALADEWADRSEDWLLARLPEPGACFAYGFTGCPRCGARWGSWGAARASWDDPGHVTCANGHRLPDADYPDPGEGYHNPDGRIHYLVGSWNSWAIARLEADALRPLCLSWLLFGEARHGERAAFLLDQFARLYPTCDAGSWDYPSNPPSGRFYSPWYQVARRLIHYVDYYDELYDSPALDQPSSVPGLTRRQNIEQNLLLNGAAYCYQQSLAGGLTNGEADYLRGALAVGCVLGIDDYITWAVSGPYGIRAMLANNVDRDGRYYETSLSYATSAIGVYLTFAEPLWHYRSARYPEGINLYADPKFRSLYELPQVLFDAAGHWPRYGDSAPDTARAVATEPRPVGREPGDYAYAEKLYARTTGAAREPFANAIAYFAAERGEGLRETLVDRLGALFGLRDFPTAAEPEALRQRVGRTDGFGQKGLAILRSGSGEAAQAALVRYGPSLNHGHYDDLNLNWYAGGYELTYDLGYQLGSTHTQVGWAKQTASHNLVVVNEQRQHLPGSNSGGSLYLLESLPGLQLVEAEARAAYRSAGVTEYRRLVALVGEGADRCLVDLFRVAGGQQHDYLLHMRGEQLAVEGVRLGPEEPGSLAGPDLDWGRQQGQDGNLPGFPNRPYWTPPPGNGYGFLVGLRRGAADGPWTATWTIDPATGLAARAIGLPEPGTELFTATAPGVYPRFPKAAYTIARRRGEAGLQSSFVTVLEALEPAAGDGAAGGDATAGPSGPGAPGRIVAAERLVSAPPGGLGVRVAGRDGLTDRLVTAPSPVRREYGEGLAAAARLARVRSDEAGLVAANLVGGTLLETPGLALRLPVEAWRGEVTAVDEAAREVAIRWQDPPPPLGEVLRGAIVRFDNPAWSRNSAYHVDAVREAADGVRLRVREATFRLGQAVLDGDPPDAQTLSSLIPHDFARTMARQEPAAEGGFFRGKRLVGPRAATTIREVVYGMPQTLRVDSSAGFAAGDVCWYEDLQPGDAVEILPHASLVRSAPGTWRVHGNTPVTVEGAAPLEFRHGDGPWQPAAGVALPTGSEVRQATG